MNSQKLTCIEFFYPLSKLKSASEHTRDLPARSPDRKSISPSLEIKTQF
ncbi:hypothetical protein DET49_12322 [Salegentibacter sp. 24]|nr:hypothetical protein DET49_12322 [Salegentibacter sp. 24]